jgi:hypothetical protein
VVKIKAEDGIEKPEFGIIIGFDEWRGCRDYGRIRKWALRQDVRRGENRNRRP